MLVYRHVADLSYFEKVIEGLKQMRAKEEEDLEDSSYQGEDEEASNADVCYLLFYQNSVTAVNSIFSYHFVMHREGR